MVTETQPAPATGAIQKAEQKQVPAARASLPFVPENMDQAWRISEALAKSSLVPPHFQGHPENILAAFFMADDLGISAMQAMREIYVVKGKPTSSTALKIALVKQSPHCLLWECVESTREKATFRTQRKGDPKPTTLTFTLEQAKQAGLYPGKPDSAWNSYPENMLRWRAASFLADLVYPDVVKGLKTKEEMDDLEEREVQGERVFPEAFALPTSAPPPPVAEMKSVKEIAQEVVKETPPPASEAPAPPPAPSAPTPTGAEDPIDVLLQELKMVDTLASVDLLAERARALAPKGHARRNEIGTAVNNAKRRVQG